MKYYAKLLAMGCFTREQVSALTENYNTAGTLLKGYLKKGYIRGVKRNLYVAVNLADNEPAVSKFRILYYSRAYFLPTNITASMIPFMRALLF